MMELTLFYTFAWMLIFTITTRSVMVIKGPIDLESMPSWFRGQPGKRLAYYAGVIAIASIISLLILAVLYLKWYAFIMAWFTGFIIASMLLRAFTPTSVICICPPFLLFVNIFLWILARKMQN